MEQKGAKRKGHRRMADIPPHLLAQLNRGEIESASLVESLAVDLHKLMKHSFPTISTATLSKMKAARDTGWLGRTKLAGALLYEDMGQDALPLCLAHPSDQVRGWGAGVIAAMPDISLKKRLSLVKPLADDPNPNTREVAWIMLRPHIIEQLDTALSLFKPWVTHKQENIRRYASEMTRPCGVWCAHISVLKDKPHHALHLLSPLKSDPSRYVQNSVANWLNDASKDNPAWVRKITTQWEQQSPTPETAYICKRALRTLRKQKG